MLTKMFLLFEFISFFQHCSGEVFSQSQKYNLPLEKIGNSLSSGWIFLLHQRVLWSLSTVPAPAKNNKTIAVIQLAPVCKISSLVLIFASAKAETATTHVDQLSLKSDEDLDDD